MKRPSASSVGPSFGVFLLAALFVYALVVPDARAGLGLTPATTASSSSATVQPSSGGKPSTKAAPTDGGGPGTIGYDRAAFGQAWSDDVSVRLGHNGCDTRNDILAEQLASPTFKPGTHNCVVMSGMLTDPYSGQRVEFRKAEAGQVQIDHVFALALAWRSGAADWSAERRRDFANDPDNLLAAAAKVNNDKSDKSPLEWSPSTKPGRCLFATRFTKVAATYGLSVSTADRAALAAMLSDC